MSFHYITNSTSLTGPPEGATNKSHAHDLAIIGIRYNLLVTPQYDMLMWVRRARSDSSENMPRASSES